MRAGFTPEAVADLEGIMAYLEPLNPAAAKRVVEAIQRSVIVICENPRIGHRTDVEGILEFIEPRYRYKLPYIIRRDIIIVLRVYHPSCAPIDYAALSKL